MGHLKKNQQSYDSADVKVSMLGINDVFATSIEYNTKQEHQANYGLGSREPRTYSLGKKEYSCSLELDMTDVVAIQNANKGKSLVDIEPFPVVVTYNPSTEGNLSPMVTDTLVMKFTESGRSVSEMDSKKSFEMFVLEINENVA
jgi:hypothetical protein